MVGKLSKIVALAGLAGSAAAQAGTSTFVSTIVFTSTGPGTTSTGTSLRTNTVTSATTTSASTSISATTISSTITSGGGTSTTSQGGQAVGTSTTSTATISQTVTSSFTSITSSVGTGTFTSTETDAFTSTIPGSASTGTSLSTFFVTYTLTSTSTSTGTNTFTTTSTGSDTTSTGTITSTSTMTGTDTFTTTSTSTGGGGGGEEPTPTPTEDEPTPTPTPTDEPTSAPGGGGGGSTPVGSGTETGTPTTSSSIPTSSPGGGTPGGTDGPAPLAEVPASASTNAPFGGGGFFITLPAGISAKSKVRRQNPGGFVGGGGNCGAAPVFALTNGVLTVDGVAVGAGDQTAETFAQARGAGGITNTWFVNNGVVGWQNDAFYNGQAGFCNSNGQLYITFVSPQSPEYPPNCQNVELGAVAAARCVGGNIVPADQVPGGGLGCQYPLGIPRGNDFYITGCPTPSQETCSTTVVSWIPGQLTFLPGSGL